MKRYNSVEVEVIKINLCNIEGLGLSGNGSERSMR